MATDRAAGNQRSERSGKLIVRLVVPLVLVLGFFFRIYDLGNTPLGVHYDEAANAILANEIAHGAWPIFIRGYTGKEVLYFYLASLIVRLIGSPLIAIRLASALIGTISVAVTYRMTVELFDHSDENDQAGQARVIATVAAVLQATNLWAITTSRLGFRALTQPLLQSLTILFLWRAMRRTSQGPHGRSPLSSRASKRQQTLDWSLAGLFCGASAYTYLAIRAFPLLLAALLLWAAVLMPIADPQLRGARRWAGKLKAIVLFLLVAAIVFAPLGLFYVKNPQFFGNRMSQVSVFATGTGDDPWAALWRSVRVSLDLFLSQGDLNWRFNVAGAPALWWPIGVSFVLGLLTGLWRLVAHARQARTLDYAAHLLLALWLPIMLLPSVLGQDVEISLSLRAIGLMPALFVWPALGLVRVGLILRRQARLIYALLAALLLMANAIRTYDQCFAVWGPSTGNYYAASAYLVDAADMLNAALPADARCYVSAEHYRHPTLALTVRDYQRLKWLIGPDAFAFPTANEQETWYVFTYEAMPTETMLLRLFGSIGQEHLAPDGQVAFRTIRFPPGQSPAPQPQNPTWANLGNTLHVLGYDVNAPAISGQAFDVTLFFQVQRPVDRDDYAFFVHLVDDAGFQWGGDTFFTYPSSQWETGETIALRFVPPLWAGAPPLEYALVVGAYSSSLDARLPALDENGQLIGTTIKVGSMPVTRPPDPPAELPPIASQMDVHFGDRLVLLGTDRIPGQLRPGETLDLSLYWQYVAQSGSSQQDPCPSCVVSLWLQGAGTRIPLWDGHPVRGQYPFANWQPGEFVRDRHALRLPIDAPAGVFELQLSVTGLDRSSFVSLGTIEVQATDRLWEPPTFAHPIGARLAKGSQSGDGGPLIELLGYDLDRQAASPGDTLHLTLIWQALDEIDTAYTVFTHLLDESQQIRGQKDNPPRNGSYPTTLWTPGEVIVDEYDIVVHDAASPGRYQIEVGMYDPRDLRRLILFDPTGSAGDRVLLGQIRVTSP